MYAITAVVGAFVVVVGVLWVGGHVVGGQPVDATAWVVLLATALRAVMIGIALSSVQRWGRGLPPALVLTGLWGCAAAQLAYPGAEVVAKLALLAGVLDLPATGIGDLGLDYRDRLPLTTLLHFDGGHDAHHGRPPGVSTVVVALRGGRPVPGCFNDGRASPPGQRGPR